MVKNLHSAKDHFFW